MHQQGSIVIAGCKPLLAIAVALVADCQPRLAIAVVPLQCLVALSIDHICGEKRIPTHIHTVTPRTLGKVYSQLEVNLRLQHGRRPERENTNMDWKMQA